MKYNKKNKKINKGFSLVEMIIYIAIFSLFVISFFAFYNIVINTRMNNQSILEVTNEGNKTIKTITQYIRNAKSVNYPNLLSEGQYLSLETYDINTNPTIFSITGDGVLQIKEGNNTEVDLTNNKVKINNLSFFNLDKNNTNELIKIRFNMSNLESGNSIKNYSSNFYGSASIR